MYRLTVFLLTFTLAACGGSNNGSGGNPSSSSSSSVSAIQGLEGSWTSGCYRTGHDAQDTYSTANYTYLSDAYSYTYLFFTDSLCQTSMSEEILAPIFNSGTYRIIGTVMTVDSQEANIIEYRIVDEELGEVSYELLSLIEGDLLYFGFETDDGYTMDYEYPYQYDR